MIYTSKRPPALEDLETPRVKFQSNATPQIKLEFSKAATGRAQSRGGASHLSSPLNQMPQARSCQVSPLNQVKSSTPKIESLVKNSLKIFKNKKKELEKIIEFAEKFQEHHREKLKNYNVQTRLDNKKFKLKTFRPKTAWASPEFKNVYIENEKSSKRKTGFSSAERRANIGLEFYNLKSFRNTTPRTLYSPIKVKIEKNQEINKDSLDKFMKKKKKERKRLEKEKKFLENQAEIKRISQLVHLEKKVKKALKKSTKGKPPRPKVKTEKKLKVKISFSKDNNKKRVIQKISIADSQDQEVQFILENGNLCASSTSNRAGRECLIFGNVSSQITSQNIENFEYDQSLKKRTKSEDYLKAISLSMSVPEPVNLSSQSSSSNCEKKDNIRNDFQKHIQIRSDFNHMAEKNLNIDIGVHKLIEYLHIKIVSIFNLLKYFDPEIIYTPQLSEFPNMQTPSPEKSSQKEHLDEILSKVMQKNNLESRQQSEDLEAIWDRIEFNSKNDAYLNNMEPLPPLTPIEDYQAKQSARGSKRQSEEISCSITDQLKKVIFPSIEYLSFGNIGEVSHEDVIDSPSLLSIASHNSEEPIEELITFGPINSPALQSNIQTEPSKPVLVNSVKMNAILIEDVSNSLSDYIGMIKESSSITTPEPEEAEEVEEFSSINFELNMRRPNDTSLNPFSISEETLMLDEEEIIDKTVNLLILFLYSETISEALNDEYKSKNFQLLGKVTLVLHEVQVRTGAQSVINFIEKIWTKINSADLIQRIMDWTIHFETLGRIQGRKVSPLELLDGDLLKIAEGPSLNSFSLSLDETPNQACKEHNRMIFDLINFMLDEIRRVFNPDPWKTGEICIKSLDLDDVFKGICNQVEGFCTIAAGRIPSIDMVRNDGNLDYEFLQKVREGGLALILESDITGDEKMWTNYGIEEGQVGFDIADFIMSDLLVELENLLKINNNY